MTFLGFVKKAWYVFECFVWVILLLIAIGVLVRTCRLETISIGRIRLHQNLAIGFVMFFVSFIIPRIRRNVRWMMSFTHEFTHLLFAILFCRKI